MPPKTAELYELVHVPWLDQIFELQVLHDSERVQIGRTEEQKREEVDDERVHLVTRKTGLLSNLFMCQ
jgi:hypothetical protein